MQNRGLLFLIVSLVALLFGFTGVANAASDIAKTVFFLFLILFLFSMLKGLGRKA